MLLSMKTAVHSGMVTPVVSWPTLKVIVLSWLLIASRTLSKLRLLLVASSSSSLPSPAASTISYFSNTGCSLSILANALALSTRSKSQKVCASSLRSSGVEKGNFSCSTRASKNFFTSFLWINWPRSLVLKNSFKSKANSVLSSSDKSIPRFTLSMAICDIW